MPLSLVFLFLVYLFPLLIPVTNVNMPDDPDAVEDADNSTQPDAPPSTWSRLSNAVSVVWHLISKKNCPAPYNPSSGPPRKSTIPALPSNCKHSTKSKT